MFCSVVQRCVIRILEKERSFDKGIKDLYSVYNIGNNDSIKLLDFIEAIEQKLGTKAQRQLLPMQPGDVEKTWANVDDLIRDYGYRPNTSIRHGVSEFIDWYKQYYKIV